ncbi:putative Ig domain-containing protein [Larkinella rosea]|uniref:T9SS C-terminal target domain-containing protein n=1 Tax=Larkinella rosea TaxID=2025312 RepID=A0A3P1BHF9_9BACT|nr:putative Ig domain-containing protein [Larkinella rosea]RRB00084.1 T9SS C-terminal target domain-containing protein [Larkinella rosea]
MVSNLPVRISWPSFSAHFTEYVFKLVFLLISGIQLAHAGPADGLGRPSPSPRNLRQAPPVIDGQRYIGLTIFNFETDPRIDDERIEFSASTGCNAVEITINWDQVYTSIDSAPNWGVIDSHVQTAQRLGLKVALRVFVGREASRLGGFWNLHETMQAADSSRRITNLGNIQFTFSSKPVIERVNSFVLETVNRYRYLQDQGQLLFFSVVSSPALESEYSPVYDPYNGSKYVVPFDYSRYELDAFRQYLQARFSLPQLNQRWGTDFSQWSRVIPPANDPANPYASTAGTRGEDWYVFRHRQLKSFIDKINSTVKGVDPSIVVVNQHGCVWDRISGLRATFAFKNLGQSADGLKFNDGPDYNHRFSMDIVRSNMKPGAFLINAIDGMFHMSVSLDKYYQQVAQCYEHGAKMITLANFGGKDARPKLTDLIAMVVNNGLLNQPVPTVQTAMVNGKNVGYKLSEILRNYTIAQDRWSSFYNQNGNKPVRIELDEDLLRNEPPIINALPVLSQTLVDQSGTVGQPFNYSIGSAFTDPDGSIVSVDVSGLPLGLQWVSATGEVTGTPTRQESSLVTLLAKDNLGATVSGSFRITVTDPTTANRSPVAPILAAQIGQVGVGMSYTLPLFTDPEDQPLVHQLRGEVPGLTFASETNVMSGTPTTAGVYSLTYTATDPAQAISSTLFQVTIREATQPTKRTGNFEGYLDKFNCEGDIFGWVWDRNLPNTPMPIEVLDGPRLIGTFMADVSRPDLVAAKKGNGAHGYQFIIPASIKDDKPHVISMRIENSDYSLKGSPTTITCPSSTAQVTDPANQPPVAVPIPIQYAYVNIPYTYTIPDFPHEEGQTLVYALTGGVLGLSYNQATRTFSGTPSTIGTYTASLIVSDGIGGYTPTLVTIVVTPAPANRPPVVSQSIADQSGREGQPFSFTIGAGTFTDPDNNLASIQVTGLPDGLSYASANKVISGTPTSAGVYTVVVKATDALSATAVTSFRITVEAQPRPAPNMPPVVVQVPSNQTATVGQTFSYQLPANGFTDPDGSIVSVAVSGLPAGLNYTPNNRIISGIPTTPQTATVTVTATDNEGEPISTTFRVVVNAAPSVNQAPAVAQLIPNQTATTGQLFTYTIGSNVFTDTDGTVAKVEVLSGLPAGLAYTQSSQLISGTPTAPSTTTVTVKATDNDGGWVTTTFKLTVNPAPDVPNVDPFVAVSIPSQTATAGQLFTYTIGGNVFGDTDGSIAKVEITGGLPAGLNYTQATRVISGTPTAPSTTTVTVKATDNDGGWVTTTFKLTVNPAPDVPNVDPFVAVSIPSQTATAGQLFTYTIGGNVFGDTDGTIAKVEVVSGLPAGLNYTQVSRVISGTPTAPSTTTVTVKATDNAGGWVTTTFKLTVNPAPVVENVAPTVAQTIPEQTATVGQLFTYTIGGNVFGDTDGTIVKVEITGGLPNGLTYTQATRVISGTPTAPSTTTVTVKATDNDGGWVTTTFKLTVNPAPNVTPVVAVTIPNQTATAGQLFTYTIGGNVFSDTDGTIAKVEITGGLPNGLTYTQSSRVISGTPTAPSTTTVTIKATDNDGAWVTTTFRLTVNPAPVENKAPTVAVTIPDQVATVGVAFTYTIGANVFADADGTIAKVEVVSGLPTGLTYTQSSRVISGTPTTAAVSTVTVKATDNQGATATTTFKITVNAPPAGANQPPILVKEIPTQTPTISLPYSYTIGKQNFSDPDGSVSSVEVTNLPTGLVYNKTTGVISGTPLLIQNLMVVVKAVDNKSASVTTTFNMAIKENIIMKLYKAGKGPEPQNYMQDLNTGTVLMSNTLPDMVNIFFEVESKAGSVKFELTGTKNLTFSENFAPWALAGDNGGILLLPGDYALRVNAYKDPNLKGNLLVSRLITFSVKKASSKRDNAEFSVSDNEPAVWGVYPNPFRDEITVNLPHEPNTQLTPLAPYRFAIVSPSGRQVPVSEQNTRFEPGKAILNVQPLGLPAGIYFLQIQRGEGRLRTLKVIKE